MTSYLPRVATPQLLCRAWSPGRLCCARAYRTKILMTMKKYDDTDHRCLRETYISTNPKAYFMRWSIAQAGILNCICWGTWPPCAWCWRYCSSVLSFVSIIYPSVGLPKLSQSMHKKDQNQCRAKYMETWRSMVVNLRMNVPMASS